MSETPHAKVDPLLGASAPLAPPLYPSSVYTLPDLDALDSILDAAAPGFIYARDAHPNAKLLADQLVAAEGATWAAVCGSGMGAITACLLSLVKQGDCIVASNRLYGRTTQLLGQELTRYGVQTTFTDTCDLEQVRAALANSARVLLVETISNPLLRLADLESLATPTADAQTNTDGFALQAFGGEEVDRVSAHLRHERVRVALLLRLQRPWCSSGGSRPPLGPPGYRS
jgi:O-acetylhomoserine/O-acetylserine sulfhydrylase-like pyridoxal-dependent enzyme